jgi:Fur family ferric uptake transcriptional regulator
MPTIRNTKQRKAIKEVFQEARRPLAPDEVCDLAQQQVPGLGIATVYRTIRNLIEENWITPVELPGMPPRYEIAGLGHHHHFQCRSCGKIFEIWGCKGGFNHMAPEGFLVESHEVILYGICPSCQNGSKAPTELQSIAH